MQQQLVQQGNDIKQDSRSAAGSGKSAVTALQSDDGSVYYAFVKACQQELDAACGAEVAVAPSSTVAASAAQAEAMQSKYDFVKLREATATAVAAAGLPATICSDRDPAVSNSHSTGRMPSEVEPEPLLSSSANGSGPCQPSGVSIGGAIHPIMSYPVEIDEAQLAAESSETPSAASGEAAEALQGTLSPSSVEVMAQLSAQQVNAAVLQVVQAAKLYDLD